MKQFDELNNQALGENAERKGFASKLGFVLAAAGSAVGLGNLWRFPYLAGKYGGGIFVFCYVALAILFGFILLMLEIAIGRKTGKGVVGAFKALNSKFKWFGYFCVAVPAIIVPYYCVIGGWVLKYLFSFVGGSTGLVGSTNTEPFFINFITDPVQSLIFFFMFAIITIAIICFGVQKGIEKMSKILMPALAIIAVALMIYVICQPGAMEGVKHFIIPDFSKFSFQTILGALGQLFYSLSLGMCIMITYGSYMKKSASIPSSSAQIAIFDSAFAIVAGLIVIPAVFAFSADPNAVLEQKGATLMFIQLTQVFNNMGVAGRIIGIIFFVLVFFAALTSSISLVEAIVAVLCDSGKIKRFTACLIVFGIIFVLGTLSALGFGVLSNVTFGGLGFLDAFDYLANHILMPIIAIITCVIAGYFIDKEILPKEIGIQNNKVARTYFNVIVKFVAPVCILIILVFGLFVSL